MTNRYAPLSPCRAGIDGLTAGVAVFLMPALYVLPETRSARRLPHHDRIGSPAMTQPLPFSSRKDVSR